MISYSDQLANGITTFEHVESVNVWEKDEKCRLYVNVASQNRFPNASTIYVDLHTGEVVAKLEKGKSGAKSYAWSEAAVVAIRALVAELDAETQGDTEPETLPAVEAHTPRSYTMDLPEDLRPSDARMVRQFLLDSRKLDHKAWGITVAIEGLRLTVTVQPKTTYSQEDVIEINQAVTAEIDQLMQYVCS